MAPRLAHLAVVLSAVLLTAGEGGGAPAPGAGAAGQGKVWHTYPMPPKPQPSDPLRINPGVEIPYKPERFRWQVAAPKNEPKLTVVPVFDASFGKLTRIGTVPLGTPLTLDQVKGVGRAHYYSLKFTTAGGRETIAWINGNYVAPAGFASDQ